jgi:hypothetical protein
MEVTSPLLTRFICAGLVMALLTPPAAMAGAPKQNEKQDQTSVQQPQAPQSDSPAPGAVTTSPTSESQPAQPSRDQLPESPDPVQSTTTDQAQPPPAAPSAPQQSQQGKTQQPAGTAAAEVENTTGDAAYKPAGAAIAPAKQKRRRMLLIKVGALLGAGVAIGSVAALSSASPSRPPGSH